MYSHMSLKSELWDPGHQTLNWVRPHIIILGDATIFNASFTLTFFLSTFFCFMLTITHS